MFKLWLFEKGGGNQNKLKMPDVLGLKPEDYWNEGRALEYDSKKNVEKTQREITLKALEILGLEKGSILDAGCGTGFSTRVVKEQGFDVVGVDVSSEMIKLAKKKGLKVVRARFSDLPFKDESFNGIISISSLQWVTGTPEQVVEEYHAIAFEFARVLKSRGVAVVQFYPSTAREFELVEGMFRKKFYSERITAWSGRKAKVFLKLRRKQ
jgi:ubiquinone/menaquinone biosynthesis C-methylase UbiE